MGGKYISIIIALLLNQTKKVWFGGLSTIFLRKEIDQENIFLSSFHEALPLMLYAWTAPSSKENTKKRGNILQGVKKL